MLVQREKPTKVGHPKFGQIEVPIKFQAENSVQGYRLLYKGDEGCVRVMTNAQEDGAIKAARYAISQASENATVEQLIAIGSEAAENFNAAAERERAATQKVKAEATTKIAEGLASGQLTNIEDIRKLLAASGIKV